MYRKLATKLPKSIWSKEVQEILESTKNDNILNFSNIFYQNDAMITVSDYHVFNKFYIFIYKYFLSLI